MTVMVNTIGNTTMDPVNTKPLSKSTTLPLTKQNQSNQHHSPTKIRSCFKFFNRNCICTIHGYFTPEIVNDSKDNNREINANTISTLKSHKNILIFENVSYVYINFQPKHLRPTRTAQQKQQRTDQRVLVLTLKFEIPQQSIKIKFITNCL